MTTFSLRAAMVAVLAVLAAIVPALAGDERLESAAEALASGHAERAASLCRDVLRERPSDPEALVLLSRAERLAGDPFAAESLLEEAARESGGGARARLLRELGLARLERGKAQAAEGRGNRSTIVATFHDARRALEAARAAGAADDDVVIAIAEAHDWSEEPESAERILREALSERPGSGAIRAALALLLLGTEGKEDDGISLARKCLEEEPGRPDLLVSLARAELARGDAAKAFEWAARALEAEPELQAVYDDVWRLAVARRRFDLSERFLSLAMERFPADAKAPYYRGHSRILEGRFADAASDFEAALSREPNLSEARLGLAEALRRGGDRRRAAEVVLEELSREPGRDDALDLLRDLAEEVAFAGDDAEALPLFGAVLASRPDDASVRAGFAIAHARTGKVTEARRILEEGVARDPDDAWLRNELGIVLEAARLWSEAEREYRAALRSGWDFDAAENLATLLLRTERKNEAIPLLEDLLRRDPIRLRSAILYERATR